MLAQVDAYQRGRRLLEEGELADAIRAFLDAVDLDPDAVDAYFALTEAYELAYEVFPDPDLLRQVRNVLRGVRDRDLNGEQLRRADEIERRVGARLILAKRR